MVIPNINPRDHKTAQMSLKENTNFQREPRGDEGRKQQARNNNYDEEQWQQPCRRRYLSTAQSRLASLLTTSLV